MPGERGAAGPEGPPGPQAELSAVPDDIAEQVAKAIAVLKETANPVTPAIRSERGKKGPRGERGPAGRDGADGAFASRRNRWLARVGPIRSRSGPAAVRSAAARI